MATVSAHLPEGSELETSFFKHVKNEWRGKPGPYIRELIERDLLEKPKPDALAPSIIVDLANRLIGEFDAQKVAAALQGKDQREVMQKILHAIIADGANGFALRALDKKIAEKREKEGAQGGVPHAHENPPVH